MCFSFSKLKMLPAALIAIATSSMFIAGPAMADRHHHGRDIILGIGGVLVEKMIEAEQDKNVGEEQYDNEEGNTGNEDYDQGEGESYDSDEDGGDDYR